MLPVFLLLIFGGIDFGRVFLGWINLNNTARIAANYAASNAVELSSGDAVAVATYNKLVTDDATATNCKPPAPLPRPTYTPDTALGSNATVQVSCSFRIYTPIISSILGNNVTVSSSAVFPVRKGAIAGVPAGGPAPVVAIFSINPMGGVAPQTIAFTNNSTGPIVSYAWDFEGDGTVDFTSSDPAPPAPHAYTVPGTYRPSLTVTNGVTPNTATKTIVITNPPGPVANFTLSLSSPTAPSTVTFNNTSTGSNPMTYAWKFGDGTTSTVKNPPTKVYPAGTWTVELKVDDALGTSTTTKTFTVLAPIPMCTVPDFKNQDTSPTIQTEWAAAGFSTTVIFNPARPPEYKIKDQDLRKGDSYPCAGTVITVIK